MGAQVGQSTPAQDNSEGGSIRSGQDRRNSPERRIDELEKADKTRQEFLARLSHELRNPLQAIHTNALLIKSRAKTGELARPAEAIDRQVNRISKILEDLLDVVRIAQRDDLVFQTLALQQVVGSAVEATRRSFDTHRRELTIEMPEAPIHVRADAGRLEKAIGNILANAVKFSGQQSEIAVRVFEQGGQGVVAVRDQGIGIRSDDLERIFTRFQPGAPKDVSGGLGLGLHIARAVASLHDGRIEARSEGPGKGAEFLLFIPVTSELPAAEIASRTKYNDARSLRILVVDDNRDSADSLATLLELNGHTGLVAYDGASALEKAEKMRPHIALVDIGMPAMNGFEVAQRISKSEWGKDTLLVAITGWGAKSDRAQSKEAGFDYHLTKPVDYDMLASLLSTAVRKPGNGKQ